VDQRAAQYQRNSEILKKYLPEQSVPLIAEWIVTYDFKLKIKKERNSRLGDYTAPQKGMNHLITINHNLNKYSFLITLVHEIAHLVTFNQHRDDVLPHGKEWKHNFKVLIQPFLNTDIFPIEVFAALRKYMMDPAASSCSDDQLLRVLKLHDDNNDLIFIERLPAGTVFLYNGNKIFRKGERIRKRFRCIEVSSGAVYLFNPLTEVQVFENSIMPSQ
jgi:SprT protein